MAGAFDQVRQDFSRVSEAALGDIRGDRSAALADVYTGQTRAMQAAVQGIQGNVDTQVAQIRANNTLTQAQNFRPEPESGSIVWPKMGYRASRSCPNSCGTV